MTDSIHDMGGMDGFGKVDPEANEPPFHQAWEGRVLAMQRAMGYAGAWNIDMSRAAQELLPPNVYLSVSYYKRWALGIEHNLLKQGLADADEIADGHARNPAKPLRRKLTPDAVTAVMTRGSSRAIVCAPRISIRELTRGCRATCADMSAPWNWCTAVMSSRTRRRSARGRIRSGFTLWCSMAANCGVPMPTPPSRSRLTRSNPISRRLELKQSALESRGLISHRAHRCMGAMDCLHRPFDRRPQPRDFVPGQGLGRKLAGARAGGERCEVGRAVADLA